jgi:hypothetical protein
VVSFARCDREKLEVSGICNKMKGSEDDFLWHQSNKESCQDDMTDSEEY